MHRRYNRWHSRFDQPDPYDGSYDLGDPQSFNRYIYVQNDPVNFADPLGLDGDRFDDSLGPPPPVPTYVPPMPPGQLDRIITNTNDQLGGVTGFLGGDTGMRIVEPLGDSIGTTGGGAGPWTGGPQGPRRQPRPDPDTVAVNTALGACSTVASIGQYSTVNPSGTMWKARNGEWYRVGWQGNQHTGGRSVALSNANSFKLLGRATFAVGAAFSGAQGVQQLQQGNTAGALKSGLDITMSAVGTFGGPKGLVVSGAYFGIDTFVGWRNCATFLTTRCDRDCRRK